MLVAEATTSPSRSAAKATHQRNEIFADAFNKDADFFTFYRSMQAYEAGLKANDTRLVLKPDTSFFRYFNDPSGKLRGRSAARRREMRRAPAAAGPLATGPSRHVRISWRLGLVFVIEGLVFAAFPGPAKRAISARAGHAGPNFANHRDRLGGAGAAWWSGWCAASEDSHFATNRPRWC